jgi:hypothetical protein
MHTVGDEVKSINEIVCKIGKKYNNKTQKGIKTLLKLITLLVGI